MTAIDAGSPCALCSRPASEAIEPLRRALGRGPDPVDPSFSVTVLLPYIPLCGRHAADVRQGTTLIGWCDDERCRIYGEADEASPCGEKFEKLKVRR